MTTDHPVPRPTRDGLPVNYRSREEVIELTRSPEGIARLREDPPVYLLTDRKEIERIERAGTVISPRLSFEEWREGLRRELAEIRERRGLPR